MFENVNIDILIYYIYKSEGSNIRYSSIYILRNTDDKHFLVSYRLSNHGLSDHLTHA